MKTTTYTCDVCGVQRFGYMWTATMNCSDNREYKYDVCDECWKKPKNVFRRLWAKITGKPIDTKGEAKP